MGERNTRERVYSLCYTLRTFTHSILVSMKKFICIVIITVACIIVWYLGSPLLVDDVVEEAFPVVVEEVEEARTEMQIKKIEELTAEDVEKMSDDEKEEVKEMMDKLTDEMPDTVAEDLMPKAPAGPQKLAEGSFQGTDALHKGSGTATVYKLEDASHLVRFENFSVTNGPALSVFLTNNTDGTLSDDAVNIGKLKGNKGSQNYTLASNVDPSAYNAVLIYCVPFKVPFAYAKLK